MDTEDIVIDVGTSRELTFQVVPSVSDAPLLSLTHDRTGLMLWSGARTFARWLRRNVREGERLPRSPPPAAHAAPSDRVLVELGAGLGLGAIAVAAVLPRTTAIITDCFEPALELARHNISCNAEAAQLQQSTVIVARNDWTAALAGPVTLRELIGDRAGDELTPVALLGLDVIYPDTRSDVLAGLVLTVRDVLRELRERTARPVLTVALRQPSSTCRASSLSSCSEIRAPR
jgi:hypothetical protein